MAYVFEILHERQGPINSIIEAEWPRYASINYAIIGSDNGLSPVWRHAVIWTNDGLLLIGHLGTNFSEMLIKLQQFSFMKMHLKCRLQNVGHFIYASMW